MNFFGPDPMNLSILVKVIRELKHTLDMTYIRVSHNVTEVFSIVDYAYIMQLSTLLQRVQQNN